VLGSNVCATPEKVSSAGFQHRVLFGTRLAISRYVWGEFFGYATVTSAPYSQKSASSCFDEHLADLAASAIGSC
jgi:hypothetical protein